MNLGISPIKNFQTSVGSVRYVSLVHIGCTDRKLVDWQSVIS